MDRNSLLAAQRAARDHSMREEAWQLCEALWGLFLFRKHFWHWVGTCEIGLASARVCGNRRPEARMRDQLCFAYLNLSQYADAQEQFTQAITLARQAGHRLGEAAALEHLGLALLGLGRPDEALDHFLGVHVMHEELGRPGESP